jgi:hypothetical protein
VPSPRFLLLLGRADHVLADPLGFVGDDEILETATSTDWQASSTSSSKRRGKSRERRLPIDLPSACRIASYGVPSVSTSKST